jgi:hypothetical protein
MNPNLEMWKIQITVVRAVVVVQRYYVHIMDCTKDKRKGLHMYEPEAPRHPEEAGFKIKKGIS